MSPFSQIYCDKPELSFKELKWPNHWWCITVVNKWPFTPVMNMQMKIIFNPFILTAYLFRQASSTLICTLKHILTTTTETIIDGLKNSLAHNLSESGPSTFKQIIWVLTVKHPSHKNKGLNMGIPSSIFGVCNCVLFCVFFSFAADLSRVKSHMNTNRTAWGLSRCSRARVLTEVWCLCFCLAGPSKL